MSKEQLFREIYEVWAGSEGIPEPVTCTEAYLLRLIEQMRDIAKKGLEEAPQHEWIGLTDKVEPVGIVNPAFVGGVEWLIDWAEAPLPDDTLLYTHPPFSPDWNAVQLLSEENLALHRRIAELEAEKVEPINIDWLSNVIRAVDGNNTLGAGALAEKIVEHIARKGERA